MFPGIVHKRARTESLRSSDTADLPPLGKSAKKGSGRNGDEEDGDDADDNEGGNTAESD